jgi:N-acetylmuramoyl-L-alanine amidase
VTRTRSRCLSGVLPIVLALLAVFATVPRAQENRPAATERLKTQSERALDTPPRSYERLLAPRQAGVRVINVDVRDTWFTQTISIDLSQRALTYEPSGNVEPLLDTIIAATASAIGPKPLLEYTFTIEGLPIDQFLPFTTRLSRQAQSIGAGGVVLVSPGHGLYWDETVSSWHLQRPRIRGIVEDLVNWDITRYLRDELLVRNVNAQMTRYPEADATAGPSGNARWEEAAKYFIQALGAPVDIWNFGVDDYARDINARPFYANWIDAAALISVHNNAGSQTGTETWYDDTNGL